MDLSKVELAIGILVAFGGFLSPVAFAVTELFKPFAKKEYLSFIAVVSGAVGGAILSFALPYLGVEGVNVVIGVLGGIIGGYLATKQYDKAAQNTYDKLSGEE